jgi:hypothetical protein
MTDTDTTIAGEVAAAVRILRDISETLRGIDTSPIFHDPHDYGQPLNPREGAQEARGDTFTPDPPTREGDTVDAPQNAAREFREGDRVCIPDPGTYVDGSRGNASSHVGEIVTVGASPDPDGDLWVEGDDWAGFVSAALVEPVSEEEPEPVPVEWPTEPGLYWVRGVDADEPVEGLAFLKYEAPTRTLIFARDHSIWEDEPSDRLTSATPMTAIPTELIEKLLYAHEVPVWVNTVADIADWLDDHEDGAR